MAKRHYAICPSLWVLTLSAATGLTVSFPLTAEARQARLQQIDIQASRLPSAIAELSRITRVSIGAEGSLPNIRTPALHGRMTVDTALARLLRGSGYVARKVGSTAWRIEKAHASNPPPQNRQTAKPSKAAPLPRITAPFETIVVTASKQEMDLTSLPMALSVVRFPEGSADPSSDTASIAASVEGLALTGSGPGRSRIFLRGFADSAFNGESQASVAVVLDEARITYAAPDPDIRLVDVERVEVIKGPQGSLYGTGALGGIYHIVTRRPQFDENRFTVAASGTNVASGGTGYSVSAIANLPLVQDKLAARLVGYSGREAGWVDTGNRQDSNFTKVSGLRAGLRAAVGADWDIDLTGFAQWLDSRDTPYVYAPRARSRPDQLPEPHDNDLRHFAIKVARDSGALRILASSGLTIHDVSDRLDATIGADSFGLADPRSFSDDRHYRVWDNELRLIGALGEWQWLAGLSYLNAQQHLVATLEGAQDQLILDDDRRTSDDIAAFGNLTVPVTDQISLDGGARIFRSTTIESRQLPSGLYRIEARRAGVTPSLALSWRPDDRHLAWIRYGSAIRKGGSDISPSGDLEQLKGDELAVVELGWRAIWQGGAQLELGAWYGWWENVQSDHLLPTGLIESENAGDAFSTGVEFSLSAPIADQWQIEGGGNFTMAKLTRNTLGFALQDRHMPAVPEYTIRSKISHDFNLGNADAKLAFGLRYVGPARLSFDPQVDRPMGNYLESSIEASARLSLFDVALAVDNVLGGKGDIFAYGNPLRFASQRQYTPQAPTHISLKISKQF